jgi:alpha-L-fucosidase 2
MKNFGKFLLTSTALIMMLSTFSQTKRLWYDKPSVKWTDALPIGNGRIGAMVFGGVEEDRIQFNEESLWSGKPREYNRTNASVHLDKIRQLLFDGEQKEANALAEKEFMGLQSAGGNREQWINEMFALKGMVVDPTKKTFDDAQWKPIRVPHFEGWETVDLDGLDGAVWFTKTFVVSSDMLNKALILDLNRIRDLDRTYVNGILVGQTASGDARRYTIPANLLIEGENRIVIQVLNFADKGGLSGYKDTSRHIGFLAGAADLSPLIDLQGSWKFFVQNHEAPAIPMYQADYQPFGDLLMHFNHAGYSGYTRELYITNALAKTSYVHGGIKYTRTYFSSAVDQVLGIELGADKPKSIDVSFSFQSAHVKYQTSILNDSTMRLHVAVKHGALFGESLLRLRIKGGKVFSKNGRLHVVGADQVFAYLSAATNFKKYNDITADPLALSSKAIAAIQTKSGKAIKANHIKEYKRYFDRFAIDFGKNAQDLKPTDQRIREFGATGDPSLLSLYVQYSRYLLISSSRPGTMPANLQGIWNDLLSPPWGSKYTTNINTEMNYWPAEPLNLSDLHDPLFKMVEEVATRGAVTAKEYYNAPGWVLHHNTDLWRGTAAINAANHGIWVTGGAWLSHHFWEHYLFTLDKDFLQRKGYPIMKGAAAFFKHFLVKDPKTGWLISSPSNSPEQGGLVAGPSMDHQIIRSLFKAVISAADILQTDKAFADSLRNMLPKIAPDQIGKYGQLQEWIQDKDDPNNKHRHVSHLWGVYPGTEIVWGKNEKFMNAAKQSLLFRGDAATGWSLGWKINLWARFRDGDHVYTLLKMLLSPAETGGAGSYINLFDAHPPFQIDGNFGGAAGIGEMLLQSHDDQIVLLPALPSALPDGNVNGICARGGFELKMEWKKRSLVAVEIISKSGTDCSIVYQGKSMKFKTEKGGKYILDGSLVLKK